MPFDPRDDLVRRRWVDHKLLQGPDSLCTVDEVETIQVRQRAHHAVVCDEVKLPMQAPIIHIRQSP